LDFSLNTLEVRSDQRFKNIEDHEKATHFLLKRVFSSASMSITVIKDYLENAET